MQYHLPLTLWPPHCITLRPSPLSSRVSGTLTPYTQTPPPWGRLPPSDGWLATRTSAVAKDLQMPSVPQSEARNDAQTHAHSIAACLVPTPSHSPTALLT